MLVLKIISDAPLFKKFIFETQFCFEKFEVGHYSKNIKDLLSRDIFLLWRTIPWLQEILGGGLKWQGMTWV